MYNENRSFSNFDRENNGRREPRRDVPFKVGLCCNVEIEVHVAMRLGELIIASETMDKQLMALGHRLANSMNQLVDQLDHRQWEKLFSTMEEQTSDEPNEGSYTMNAQKSFCEMEHKNNMKGFVSSVISKK